MEANFIFGRGRGPDKKPRKKRRPTRLAAAASRKAEVFTKMFEPEPTPLEKAVSVVKKYPITTLTGVGTVVSGIAALSNPKLAAKAKGLTRMVRELGTLASQRGGKFSEEDTSSEFARRRGSKDKRKRKKRLTSRRTTTTTTKESGVDPKVRENYYKAQTFRSWATPIIYGVRETRGAVNLASRMANMSRKTKTADFGEYNDYPVNMDMKGKKIRGQGGIVKILAHLISTEQPYKLEYNPSKYDSSGRYYERVAQLLSDDRGNLKRAKDVGGKPDLMKSQVLGQRGLSASQKKAGGSMLKRQY